MRVIVCGGRKFVDIELLERYLDRLHAIYRFELLIHGGARGADLLAELWAMKRHVDAQKYPANWQRFGRQAGPIRNMEMIDRGNPDLVVAFKGGPGTRNMRMLAAARGLRVIDLDLPTERDFVDQQYGAVKAIK